MSGTMSNMKVLIPRGSTKALSQANRITMNDIEIQKQIKKDMMQKSLDEAVSYIQGKTTDEVIEELNEYSNML